MCKTLPIVVNVGRRSSYATVATEASAAVARAVK